VSAFLYRLAKACFRHRWRVLLIWLVVLAALGTGALASPKQFDDNFQIPGAESMVALAKLKVTFPQAADASSTVLLNAPEGTNFNDETTKEEVEKFIKMLEQVSYVKGVNSPYLEQLSGQISEDGRSAILTVRVKQTISEFPDSDREDLVNQVNKISQYVPGATANAGGDIFAIQMPTIGVTELLGLIVAIFVLIATLGSVFGMIVPVVTALTGVGIGVSIVVLDATLTSVSATTMLLAVMIGLAVGLDYALFIISRHRDQLATGMDVEESAARAVGTAGSAVVFAGGTVIIALCGLAIAGLPFLTIMGLLSAATVATQVVLALTALPAMLAVFGEKLRPSEKHIARASKQRWRPATAWAKLVTKVPIVFVVILVAGMGALAIPASHIQLALPNSGHSTPGSPDRVAYDLISEKFGPGYNAPLIVTGSIVESSDPMKIVDGIKADVENMQGVQKVVMATPNGNADTMLIQLMPTTGPDDQATYDLVSRLRAMEPEWKSRYGIDVAVTGVNAAYIDVTNRLSESMLPFGAFVVGLSFVLLMCVFRSLWVPLKAALGYLLSVGGAFGATTLVFNDGIGKQLINLPETAPVISFLPIFGMGILFGLAMDYEVFLTSRMREEWVHGNRENYIVDGFSHSAKVVAAAGIIMFSVFVFFVPATTGMVKPIAFCLAVGVALDAFLVRMTFGPAVMKLLGKHAWWLPKWLDKILPTLDIEGEALTAEMKVWDKYKGTKSVVELKGLEAEVDGQLLFGPLDITIDPGGVLVVAGPPASTRALVYAMAGRTRLSEGEGLVAGHVLGSESDRIRRDAALLIPGPGFDEALKAANQPLVLIDQAYLLTENEVQLLHAKFESGGKRKQPQSWVLAVRNHHDIVGLKLPYYETLQIKEAVPCAS
jgi:RND superfamily putative drug exporter